MKRPTVGDKDHNDGGRELIYVTGWPKSGCTWLVRLLGDVLNCPTGGAVPKKDYKEIAAEGWDRPGKYVVRKTHFVLIDEDGPLVPRPHRLNWKKLAGERIIHIMRDPRDIAVSMAFYFEYPIEKAIQQLRDGWRMPIEGGWASHIAKWMDPPFTCTHTSYEALSCDCAAEMRRILATARIPYDHARVDTAVQCQSFAVRRQHIIDQGERYKRGEPYEDYLRGTEWQLRFMRKGIAGDWVNHFTRGHGKSMQKYFGEAMMRLGYIENKDWWKSL